MKKAIIILCVVFISLSSFKQAKAQLFDFEPDLRIFTAYAFINACGYNHDWLEMDSMRIDVRKHINLTLEDDFRRQIRKYKRKTKLGWCECGLYALNLDNAPAFNWVCDTCNLELKNSFTGLDDLYRQFYEKAEIETLWHRYKNTLDSINYSYQPYAQKAVNDIINFTKIDSTYYSKYAINLHFNVCPLMSHLTNFNYRTNDSFFIVNGPSYGKPGPEAFYHEALHPPIAPIIDKHKDLLKNFEKLYDCAQEKLKGNYPGIINILNESFVRTIGIYLSGQYYKRDSITIRNRVENEYKLGYIFSLYIYENIPKYLESNMSFEEYYPVMMADIDVEKEIVRWSNFKKQ